MLHRRSIIFTIALVLFLSFSVVKLTEVNRDAEAAAIATGTVTASSLNVRSAPNINSSRITSLPRNTVVQIHETQGSWHKIRVNNRWGYVHRDFIRLNQQSSNSNVIATGEVTASSLNVRSQASTNGRIVSSLRRGAKVDIFETVGKWHKIRVNNQWAYVHGDFIRLNQQPAPQQPNQPSQGNNVIGTGEVTASSLNVRTQPSTSASRITSLSRGTKVDIYETTNNWHKIRVNNRWGYVHGSFIRLNQAATPTPTPTPTPPSADSVIAKGKVTASSLNVRAQPSTSSTRISAISRGTEIDIYETNNSWHKIRVSNRWGYVHSSFVEIVNPSNNNNASNTVLRGRTIAIDPGHGGSDPGAVGHGLKESDLVLAVGLKLEQKLRAAGVNVVMTRTTDTFVSLSQRTTIARQADAEAFISLHINGSTASSAHGIETYWNRLHSDQESRELAEEIQKKLIEYLNSNNRGVKEGNFQVIRGTMPSVLVEMGFITNRAEAERMATRAFQEQAAEAIYQGLIEFYKDK